MLSEIALYIIIKQMYLYLLVVHLLVLLLNVFTYCFSFIKQIMVFILSDQLNNKVYSVTLSSSIIVK